MPLTGVTLFQSIFLSGDWPFSACQLNWETGRGAIRHSCSARYFAANGHPSDPHQMCRVSKICGDTSARFVVVRDPSSALAHNLPRIRMPESSSGGSGLL